jgi:predicted Zn finger-like uncharacterized protein
VYTQCSKCETVFRLSAEVLRAAGGQVRCGRCGEVFNALARLAEDSSGFVGGESPLDLETRADSILESVVAPQVAREVAKDYEEFAHPGVEIAQLEVLDWSEPDQPERRSPASPDARGASAAPEAKADTADDQTLEFTLPPGELDRIFVESKQRAPKRAPPAAPPDAAIEPEPVPVPVPASESESESKSKSDSGSDADADSDAGSGTLPHPESTAIPTVDRRHRGGGFVSEDVRREMLEGIEQDVEPAALVELYPAPAAVAPRRQFQMWLGAAIAATLLLIFQMLHQNREWFVAHGHGPFGGVVRLLYGALGSPLPVPANLSAYQLRQWGVTGDPEAHGKLRLRASILNTAAQLQPYPLLRVTLADRFGKSIGTRDFEPSEYLGKPTARLLAPGERADANLEILDPGKNAEGFELDVCMRVVDRRVACAADAAAQSKQAAAQ